MKILIAGASGLIGRATTAALKADGHDVIRLVRRPAAASDELSWYPAAGEVPLNACRSADAIINLCGEDIAASRWTSKRRNELRSSRIDTTQTLARVFDGLEAGKRPGVFLSASATGIYGDRATWSSPSRAGREMDS